MPPKTRKVRKLKKREKIVLHVKGGIGEHLGLPECTLLSQFQMSDENITGFKRFIHSPMDCFINALQLFGLLDSLNANLLRISSAGRTGFSKEEIEMIFILFKGNNFDFKSTNNYNEFSQSIVSLLHPGYAVFAGYTGHVFIIARTSNNAIIYIDPQIPVICDLSISECETLIQTPDNIYYLLFNSQQLLTTDQIRTLGIQI
jgi:hypothetical protein